MKDDLQIPAVASQHACRAGCKNWVNMTSTCMKTLGWSFIFCFVIMRLSSHRLQVDSAKFFLVISHPDIWHIVAYYGLLGSKDLLCHLEWCASPHCLGITVFWTLLPLWSDLSLSDFPPNKFRQAEPPWPRPFFHRTCTSHVLQLSQLQLRTIWAMLMVEFVHPLLRLHSL